MKKALLVAVVGVLVAVAAPCFAQGPFADVPIDHWAYEAVSQLQEKGIVIGYPDGTFSGKRAMTRYEFALAMSRAIPVIVDLSKGAPVPTEGVTEEQVKQWIKDAAPAATGNLNSSDIDALKKTMNEFKDELSGLGVDMDALKRDVAGLEERVAAIEAEMKRLKITTKLSFFAIGESQDMAKGQAFDKDGRPLTRDNNLLKDLTVVRDADVIFNYANGETKGKVVINAGDYLNYLGKSVTNFAGAGRSGLDQNDDVTLFLAYGQVPFLGADFTVGRFPIQFTKWTLKKFDVDSYTENWKTDDGNYYVDGAKAAWTWGTVDILAFAGKNNGTNDLYNLVSRPQSAGLLKGNMVTAPGAGNLTSPVQSTGVRAAFNLASAKVGVNWISVGEDGSTPAYEQANIWGADLEIPFGSIKLTGDYTQSDSTRGTAANKVDSNNTAWDVNAQAVWGGLDINAGYKRIEPNFSAPGDWARVGMWQNPANIQGPEIGLKYALNDKFAVRAYGGFFDGVDDSYVNTNGGKTNFAPALKADMKLRQYKAGVGYKASEKSSFDFEGEWVQWDPTGGSGKPKEAYYTVSYSHLLTDNSKLRLLYQIQDYDPDGSAAAPYGTDQYKGAVAAAQVSMDF